MSQTTNDKQKNDKIFDGQILKRIFKYVQPYIGKFYFIVFLTIFVAALSPVRPWLTQMAIDDYIVKGDYPGLTLMLGIMLGITLLQAIIQFLHTYLSGWLGQQIVKDLRVNLYKHLLNHKLSFYDKTPIGKLVTRVISDIETLSEIFTNGLAAIIADLLQLVFILIVMLMMDWKLTLVTMITFPIMVYITYVFKEKVKVTFGDVRNSVSKLNTFVQEHVTGMSIVQIFNSEKREFEKFEAINRAHKKANIRTVLYYSVYFPAAEIMTAISTGLLVWYGSYKVIEHEIAFGTLVAFIMFMQLFFRPLRMLADRFNTLQLGIVSSDRILKLLDNYDDIQGQGDIKDLTIEGNITFENVWFAYKEEQYVLKDINFAINKGETLAFVGATGAGKSSIINLISRFYEINRGAILIDGVNVQKYQLATLRRQIGVVLQDVFLFSDTIRYNITLGDPSITEEQILQASKLVGAHEFIQKLPGGYDYNVMERGATLSVGQRQLISFVRTMVYDPQVIILDEATSSVDGETEEMIQKAIENILNGRTAIVIAHRLATIQKANKIIVLEKGTLVEQGTHEDLLAAKGTYAQLHAIQYESLDK